MQNVHSEVRNTGRAPKRRKIGEAEHVVISAPDQPTQENWESANKYGNVDVSADGTVWQGNHYGQQVNNYYAPQVSHHDALNILLSSLAFERMDARFRSIAAASLDTCQWLFRHPAFCAWLDENRMQEHGGFLWMKGKPGSGKSTIIREAVIWAENSGPTKSVLTYFFNARSSNKLEKSSLGLYRSLVHQLLNAYPEGRTPFVNTFARKVRDGKVVEDWVEEELQNFLLKLAAIDKLPPATIFIDALDEGEDDDIQRMISFLEDFTRRPRSNSSRIWTCLSSRHYPHISVRRGFSIIVEKQPEHSHDIDVYIREKLFGDSDDELRDLQQRVRDRSGGIFLWVVLVIPMLNKLYNQGRNIATRIEQLNEVPQGLYDVFNRIMARDDEDIVECLTLFRWILFSLQPLQPIELCAAIRTSIPACADENAVSAEEMTRYLRYLSRGLVEITAADPPFVQFIHETVRGFLMQECRIEGNSSSAKAGSVSSPDFQVDNCHMTMAEDCLQYLIALGRNKPTLGTGAEQQPLARYAAQYWWRHIQASNKRCSQKLLSLAQELVLNQTNLLMWVRNFDVDRPWIYDTSIDVTDLAPPLYYATKIGFGELVSILLQQKVDVNAQGENGNALQVASAEGHEKIVQMLLDKGADVNTQGGFYGSALQAASAEGHEQILQMLLDKGADINARGGEDGSALQRASVGGHEKIVQMLLDKGADVNTQGGDFGSALQAASAGGHEKIVQMLLDKGADVNTQGGFYGSALQAASAEGHEQILQMLLDKGADVNAQGGRFGSVLQAASAEGHEKIVQMLLDKGADVNTQGGRFGSALQAAAGGHEKIVQMLLDKGADVNTQGGRFGSALQAAAGGHEKIVQMLLDKGADVNAQGGDFGSALQAAAGGHGKIVQMLLDKGADVNAQGGDFGSALQVASAGGHEKIVQMLLDKGADVNTQGGRFGSALQVASAGGHEKIVQMLLDKGADVNTQGGLFGSALQVASAGGHEKIVQMLLDKGADVNTQGGLFGSALQEASGRSRGKIVQMLLEHGAK